MKHKPTGSINKNTKSEHLNTVGAGEKQKTILNFNWLS